MVNSQYSWDDFLTPETYQAQKKPQKIFSQREDENFEEVDQIDNYEMPESNENYSDFRPIEDEKPTLNDENPPKQYNWTDFKTPETYAGELTQEDEGWLNSLGRTFFSGTARVAESFLGKTGDLVEGAENLLVNVPQISLLTYGLSKMMGEEKWKNFVKGEKIDGMPENVVKRAGIIQIKPPTSKQLRSVTEYFTGDYTKPRSKKEEKFQDTLDDIGAIVRGRPKGESLFRYAANMIGIPFASKAAEETADALGLSEGKKKGAKALTFLSLNLLNNVSADKFLSNYFNETRQNLPIDKLITPRYTQNLNKSIRTMIPGDPRSSDALDQVYQISQQIKNGQNNLGSLITRYDAINAIKRSKKLFEYDKDIRKSIAKNLDKIRIDTKNEIRDLTGNSRAYQAWADGIQASAAVHQSKKLVRNVENSLKGHYGKLAQGATFTLFGGAALKAGSSSNLAMALPASALYKSGQVAYRVWSSPLLANYYWNALSGLAKDNTPIFLKNAKKLEEKYQELYENPKNLKKNKKVQKKQT